MSATHTLKRKQQRPLGERGRMMSVEDVLKLMPKKDDGTPSKSRYWVVNQFLHDRRRKIGKTLFWWECDVLEYLDSEATAA